MPDSRLESYARLIVERCVNVQPGWQVVLQSGPLAQPLLEEVVRCIAQRGAYYLPSIRLSGLNSAWANAAPESLVSQLPPLIQHLMTHADAVITIGAPENTRDGSDIPPRLRQLQQKAGQPVVERVLTGNVPWVYCQYPTQALAQDAGMSLRSFEDFLYGACLLDWDEVGRKMQRISQRFDQADQVRIVGDGTDLTLSLKGRKAEVDAGHNNMPGGEVFYSPVENSAEGVITFDEFPAIWDGVDVEGIRLEFRQGRVVEASARRGEETLLAALDTDPGARYLGELGIGCNPGIKRFMRNILFDEKIYGTIHLAVGSGFPHIGGRNQSAVHWDIIKDVRQGGKIYCDGELVQENGNWVF